MSTKDVALLGLVAFTLVLADIVFFGSLVPHLVSSKDSLNVAFGIALAVLWLWAHFVGVLIYFDRRKK